jgi:hypothetical protein|tara:strand:- start:18 stop:209 length:192 start_codon:yes stop_codon:yes gene_type:complete
MKKLEDPKIVLNLDIIVKDLYPDLNEEQIDEVIYEVYHHLNMHPLVDQVQKKAHEYVHAMFPH